MTKIILKGTSASLGKIQGKVKILKNLSDVSEVKKGDILVFEMSDQLYKPAIDIASGVITDFGGMMIHAAIKSRRTGIPCIVNTKQATKILQDGQLIILNANTGEITSQ
ncbi:MAG: PEP-utilizing enzyme [bacterium]|nr:PEP-utilizing enzyme [bacterium]